MLFRKEGFPEEGELVMCTVTSVQFHSVFVEIDEYKRGGMIHISEVSPGRIRNIRDFVKENKKIVCKVLRINKEKGYIDLSLRRVNESEKRRKIDEIKREQNAEKIAELTSKKLGLKTEEFYNSIQSKISGKYVSVYQFFEDVSKDQTLLDAFNIESKQAKQLFEIIAIRIKPSEVEVKGKMKISIYAPNGVDIVRESLAKAKDLGNGKLNINYLGSGLYRFQIIAPDYKEAEKLIKAASDSVLNFVEKNHGAAEFTREE